jgi:hypothetical protein
MFGLWLFSVLLRADSQDRRGVSCWCATYMWLSHKYGW